MLEYLQEKYANIFFHVYLIIKNMAFTITKADESSVNGNTTQNTKNKGKANVWKQLVYSFFASIPFLTHGVQTTLGLSTSIHAGHFIPEKQDGVHLSTTAMIVAALVTAPLQCYLADRYGRKTCFFLVCLVQGASCIPLFISESQYTSISLHVLVGVSSGGLFTVLPAYIREMSDDSVRGCNVAITAVMTTLGYMTRLVMYEDTAMIGLVVLLAMQILGIIILPESPSYLVKKEKYEEAKTELACLKSLDEEDAAVSQAIEDLKEESDRAKISGSDTLCGILKNRIYLDVLKIGITLYTILALCGSIVFLDQEKALEQLKMGLDPEKTLIVSSLLGGSVACFILMSFIERKHLLSVGLMTMCVSIGVLAVYTQHHLTVVDYRAVPLVSLGVTVVAYGVAWVIPTVIMVEITNFEIRTTLLGVIFTYSQIIKLIQVHTFQYIEEYVGVFTLLYLFAGINLFGVVYTLFAVPDLKNKNVKQIEKQLKRIPLLHFKTIKV